MKRIRLHIALQPEQGGTASRKRLLDWAQQQNNYNLLFLTSTTAFRMYRCVCISVRVHNFFFFGHTYINMWLVIQREWEYTSVSYKRKANCPHIFAFLGIKKAYSSCFNLLECQAVLCWMCPRRKGVPHPINDYAANDW
jgi:hypothetical protein